MAGSTAVEQRFGGKLNFSLTVQRHESTATADPDISETRGNGLHEITCSAIKAFEDPWSKSCLSKNQWARHHPQITIFWRSDDAPQMPSRSSAQRLSVRDPRMMIHCTSGLAQKVGSLCRHIAMSHNDVFNILNVHCPANSS